MQTQKTIFNILIILSILFIASCSSIPRSTNDEDIIYDEGYDNYAYYSHTANQEYDEYSQWTTINSDRIKTRNTPKSYWESEYLYETDYFIKGFVSKDGIKTFYIYILIEYTKDWRFYNRAASKEFDSLKFNEVGSDFYVYSADSVWYSEAFTISGFDDSFLSDDQDTEIKLYSKSGIETIITITKRQKESFNNLF